MTIEQYIDKLNTRYKSGISTEHSYRGDLQTLIETLCDDVLATNEPTRVACGAPDYILTKKNIPVGYIEAKDLGANLTDKAYKEQFDRYKASLPNLIFTNYIDFHLYRDGELATTISIGKIENGKLIPLTANYSNFQNLLKDFATHISQTIRSAEKLSKMMAAKARLLAAVIESAVTADEENITNELHEEANNSLRQQLDAFKQVLIHDITAKDFADIYAQTIAYGMFAARLHDPSLDTFTRIEAAELIPKSNPFLRKLFQYVAGYDLDDRIKWIVDALADIFRATDVAAILQNFGKATQQQDPIIHFYETFLAEYDPKLRKARGVWYTPEPVVNFIVRAVDDILKTEFGLKDGLADTSKTKVKIKTVTKATADARSKIKETETEQEVHKVQILDPATGTGTFLAEIIKHIYKKFTGQQGIWSRYVDDHLIPRLNGFEILMASYAMAHLKLDLLLTETGYKAQKDQRFKVFLTNSLEEYHPDTGTLFANWLSTEANEANRVKRDTPVMVVLGNPPYSGESQNKGEWIMNLMEDYKKEPGGVEKLKERNPKWINDDYVKFLRYGQHFIEKNGEGVLAFINPHGFLDNPTFRGMRWHLLKTYDKIYTIDLHGNSNKKEKSPDGGPDENVFDIQQGVSINFFIKNGSKKSEELAQVFNYDCYGKREDKYEFLFSKEHKSIIYKNVPNQPPAYFFTSKDFEIKDRYETGFQISTLFTSNSVGIVTSRDGFVIDESSDTLSKRIKSFFLKSKGDLQKEYSLKENGTWKIEEIQKKAKEYDSNFLKSISYRPFDNKFVYYSPLFIERGRFELMNNLLDHENVGLSLCRQLVSESFSHIFLTSNIVDDSYVSNKSRERGYVFPLYLYPENNTQLTTEGQQQRQPNLNKEIVDKIAATLNLTFVPELSQLEEASNLPLGRGTKGEAFAPIHILDYIYAVLHSPTYRNKYKEFLKIDFPRVPYPKNKETFWQLVKLGGELRQIHLLESPTVEQYITQYPIDGSNTVDKIRFEENYEMENAENIDYINAVSPMGRVYINDTQYFQRVPTAAWEFYIGGYQPAQKWLKDRKGRTLAFEDILHYQKIIVALHETETLMRQIDAIELE